jgi:mRNA-degrading endonuclease RelE of RelBE toxin-antitoxin system
MSYSFVNRPTVKLDIVAATEYYKKISHPLAKQFLTRVREAKAQIARAPHGFQVKYNNVRTLLLKQFPYHIHYLIDDSQRKIIIIAIIHAYKNPQDYLDR